MVAYNSPLVHEVFAVGVCTVDTPANRRIYAAHSAAELRHMIDTHVRYTELKPRLLDGHLLSHTGTIYGVPTTCAKCGDAIGDWHTYVAPAKSTASGTYYPNLYVRNAAGEWVINTADGCAAYCLDCGTR